MECLPSYKDDLYLAHHGIKGQKWGVRRFQNSDGSYTSAGKNRYGGKSTTRAIHNTGSNWSKSIKQKWNNLDPAIKKKLVTSAITAVAVGGVAAYGHANGGEGIHGSYTKGIDELSQKNPFVKKMAYAVDRRVQNTSDDLARNISNSNGTSHRDPYFDDLDKEISELLKTNPHSSRAVSKKKQELTFEEKVERAERLRNNRAEQEWRERMAKQNNSLGYHYIH